MFRYLRYQLGRLLYGVFELGAVLVWPIEKAVGTVVRTVLSASEGVDPVGSFFGRVVWWLTWPVHAVWRVIAAGVNAVLLYGVFELGAVIVWPIEKAAGAVVRTVLSASEGVDLVGSFFGRVVWWLTWPVRAVWRVIAAGVNAVLPEAVRDWLTRAGDWLVLVPARFFARLLQVSESLNLDPAVLWLVWLLQPLWRPIAVVIGFAHAWFVTRDWRQIRWSLPAVLMLLPFAVVWARTSWLGNGVVVSRYQLAVKEALEERDYDRAELYQRKLAQLGVDTELTDFRTALALAEEEKLEETYERMKVLAPEDRPGYLNAHFWIIQQLMEGKLVDSSDEGRSLAKLHMDHLESLGFTGPQLQWLRALLLAQGNQLAEAATALEPLVSIIPGAAFERMRIDLALNRPEDARRDARSLVTHMSSLARRRTQLTPTGYLWWLAAEEVLGTRENMRTIIDQWLKLEPENEKARAVLAIVYHRQAAQLLRDPLPDAQQIVDLWFDAAELDQSLEPLPQLARELYREREQAPIYDRVLEVLRDSPRTPAEMLTTLGTLAAMAKRYDEAVQYLAASVEKDATDAVSWNNYGLVLGESGAENLEEALFAVNRSLELAPQEYRFRETRGQILLRLERWEEAIEDLEYALNGLPGFRAIHRSLATAYAALGDEELARVHGARAE